MYVYFSFKASSVAYTLRHSVLFPTFMVSKKTLLPCLKFFLNKPDTFGCSLLTMLVCQNATIQGIMFVLKLLNCFNYITVGHMFAGQWADLPNAHPKHSMRFLPFVSPNLQGLKWIFPSHEFPFRSSSSSSSSSSVIAGTSNF
jgi:hypothetical protein